MKINYISSQDESAIWSKSKSIGLPRYLTVPAIEAFLKWGRSSGWEFAISRFKAMKTNLLRITTGLDPIWETGEYPRKGISWFKGLVTLSQKGDVLLSKSLSLLNVYTFVVLDKRTNKQEMKFISGVSAPSVTLSKKFTGKLLNAASSIEPPPKVEDPRWFLDSEWSAHRRTPSVAVSDDGKLDMFVTKPEFGGVLDSVLQLLAGVRGGDLLSLISSHPNLDAVFKGLGIYENKSLIDKLGSQVHEKVGLLGGCISFIQEAGGKLRAVANPYRWWQAALDPLAESIHGILKQLPWDCTHEQWKPFQSVQASLRRGDEWFSVDISSATDHFPLEYQLEVLRFIYQRDSKALDGISLFAELSRLPWWYNDRDGNTKFISWQKGQPMGLRPSFGSFALTHGLVLLALNQGRWEEDFYVLGDDVIIRGKELHQRYRYFLEWHEIPVSEAKTLQGRFAEFASKVITPSSVVPIYKWRRSTPDNFVDLARLWGPNSYPLFSQRARKVLDKLAGIPVVYGGLAWGDPMNHSYHVPKWIGKRIGRGADISLVRNYLKQIYTSDSVAKVGVVPVIRHHDVTDYETDLAILVNSVMGITTTSDSLLKSLASNIVEVLDIHLPNADLDGKPKSKLALWEQRLGLK